MFHLNDLFDLGACRALGDRPREQLEAIVGECALTFAQVDLVPPNQLRPDGQVDIMAVTPNALITLNADAESRTPRRSAHSLAVHAATLVSLSTRTVLATPRPAQSAAGPVDWAAHASWRHDSGATTYVDLGTSVDFDPRTITERWVAGHLTDLAQLILGAPTAR